MVIIICIKRFFNTKFCDDTSVWSKNLITGGGTCIGHMNLPMHWLVITRCKCKSADYRSMAISNALRPAIFRSSSKVSCNDGS